jgi:hypothetical protein
MNRLAFLTKNRWPFLAVLGGSVAALAGFRGRPMEAVVAEPSAKIAPKTGQSSTDPWDPALIPPLPSEPEEAAPGANLAGQVLEQIDVDKYSYLRLGEPGAPGTWTAVPVTTSRLGKRVTVTNAELMTHFVSATLNRTFETIYFGVLDAPRAPNEVSHVAEPAAPGAMDRPHPGAGPSADSVAVGHLSRATGPLGTTVAELNTAAAALSGKKVRVHAIVVKSTSGVLGRTFLHVRDGSGSAEAATNDLAVTSASEFPVGKELLLEGTVSLDADFGSGYRYRVLLTDAAPVAE